MGHEILKPPAPPLFVKLLVIYLNKLAKSGGAGGVLVFLPLNDSNSAVCKIISHLIE